MKNYELTMEKEMNNNHVEEEKQMGEFLNEGSFYEYLKSEKTENPWEEKDFISAFIYL